MNFAVHAINFNKKDSPICVGKANTVSSKKLCRRYGGEMEIIMKMKRKLLCLALAALTLFSSLTLISCGNDPEPAAGTVTRMTVDINPSVEFMIDDQNKVVSVTALNDDGSIIIVGEAFVGKMPEEAVELMVSVATETGYLVKGNVSADENAIKISVSGDDKYAERLLENVQKKASDTLKKLDIEGKVEKAEALTSEALRELALATSLYTEAELAEMSDEQLCKVIAAGRVETALLLTEDMKAAYYAAKDYEISFAESEEVAKIIEGMGGLYTLTHTAYKTALDVYSAAIKELDDLRYSLLVSPESEYQKSLVKLREAKVELLKQKSYTASLDINGNEYLTATVTLQRSEEAYERALAAYEALGQQANAAVDALLAKLRQAETQLKALEDTLFDDNVEAKLTEKANEIEAAVNNAKNDYFDKFESAHKADIEAVQNALTQKKQELKASIEAEG